MIDQATHTFQVFRRVVQFSVVEPQRCAIERGADAEELALLKPLQYLHFFAVLPDSPGGAEVSLQDRPQMRFAAMDEETGMRGFYRGIGCRRRRCPGCTPAWSCAALRRPLLDGAPLRIDVLCGCGEEVIFISERVRRGELAAGGRLA